MEDLYRLDLAGLVARLTVLDQKRRVYLDDLAVRIGAASGADALGPHLEDLLRRLAILVIKPDGLARRVLIPVLDFLRLNGYRIVATDVGRISAAEATLLWKYQWNRATDSRIQILLRLLDFSPSIVLYCVLCDDGPVPGSVRLWQLKGSAAAHQRGPDHLRTLLGMTNRTFGLVHASDEPADVLRELGIRYGANAGARLRHIDEASRGDRECVRLDDLLEVQESVPPSSLMLRDAVAALTSWQPSLKANLAAAGRSPGPRDAMRFVGALLALVEEAPLSQKLSLLVVASAAAGMDIPGVEPIIDPASCDIAVARWTGRPEIVARSTRYRAGDDVGMAVRGPR